MRSQRRMAVAPVVPGGRSEVQLPGDPDGADPPSPPEQQLALKAKLLRMVPDYAVAIILYAVIMRFGSLSSPKGIGIDWKAAGVKSSR
jgi:hypothetical protein